MSSICHLLNPLLVSWGSCHHHLSEKPPKSMNYTCHSFSSDQYVLSGSLILWVSDFEKMRSALTELTKMVYERNYQA